MKGLTLAAAMLCVAAVSAVPGYAQNTGIGKGKAAASSAEDLAPNTRSGTVAAIDAKAQTFTCHWASGDVTFQVTPGTVIMLGSARTSFTALRKGASVEVSFTAEMDGNDANSVTIAQ